MINSRSDKKEWPCYFSKSTTTGEKDYEEFFMDGEILDFERYEGIGIVKKDIVKNPSIIRDFKERLNFIKNKDTYHKEEIVELFKYCLPDFEHKEKGKYLDEKM